MNEAQHTCERTCQRLGVGLGCGGCACAAAVGLSSQHQRQSFNMQNFKHMSQAPHAMHHTRYNTASATPTTHGIVHHAPPHHITHIMDHQRTRFACCAASSATSSSSAAAVPVGPAAIAMGVVPLEGAADTPNDDVTAVDGTDNDAGVRAAPEADRARAAVVVVADAAAAAAAAAAGVGATGAPAAGMAATEAAKEAALATAAERAILISLPGVADNGDRAAETFVLRRRAVSCVATSWGEV